LKSLLGEASVSEGMQILKAAAKDNAQKAARITKEVTDGLHKAGQEVLQKAKVAYEKSPLGNEIGAVGKIERAMSSAERLNPWNEFQKATKGQFAGRAEAAEAYRELYASQSPWPSGYTPKETLLKSGQTFEMVIEPGQTVPGRWGTLEHITSVDYARNTMAVTEEFKPGILKVQTYEVIKPLPVRQGPVGPQIDRITGHYRPGGKTQIEILVEKSESLNYLKPIGRPRRIK